MQQKHYKKRLKKWQIEENEITNLNKKIDSSEFNDLVNFKKYPLSSRTYKGLTEFGFKQPTEIQTESILLALKGCDILGSAKTGSGKTLAFLIPVLENLYRQNWTNLDGLGALIISPTRELAYQTFEVLKKIGKYHDFSAAVVMGGKDLNFEKQKISKTNILIATPGRLLQHIEQTSFFACDNLKILVLDEADRILDMGFQHTVNAIIESIPKERQTLLFSATQTKSVKDLARLSLKDPRIVEAKDILTHSTPQQLLQTYIVCELHEKIAILYSFIKLHLKQKILIFLTSCKQVKYVYNLFCRLKPGISILALFGTMNQIKRVAAYEQFSSKSSACLIATDIAARGLDFPEVHWVVQMDCPEDINTHIHRVGRTARYCNDGKALLFLMPSEEPFFVEYLHQKNIPCKKTSFNVNRILAIQGKVESECARDVNLKIRAQKCFISYLRAIFLMKDKKLFEISKLDTDKYAFSLGLAIPPRIRFLHKRNRAAKRDTDKQIDNLITADPSQQTSENITQNIVRGHKYGQSNFGYDKLDKNEEKKIRKLEGKPSGGAFKIKEDVKVTEDLFTIKPANVSHLHQVFTNNMENALQPSSTQQMPKKALSKVAHAKKLLKFARSHKISLNTHITFVEDKDSTEIQSKPISPQPQIPKSEELSTGLNIEEAVERMKEQDILDKKAYRDRIKAMHKNKKKKENIKKKRLKVSDGTSVEMNGEFDTLVDYSEILEEDPILSEIVQALPDPDKVFNNSQDCGDSLENIVSVPSKAQIFETSKKKSKKCKQPIADEMDNFTESLRDAEKLAFRMIENS